MGAIYLQNSAAALPASVAAERAPRQLRAEILDMSRTAGPPPGAPAARGATGVAAERALRKLRAEILDMSGTAVLLSCAVLAGETEVRAAFQAARDDEYEEIVDKCEDFLGQVD